MYESWKILFGTMSTADLVDSVNIDKVGLYLALGATVTALLTSSLGSIFSASRTRSKDGSQRGELAQLVAGEPDLNLDQIDFEDHSRLDEIRTLQIRYQRQARRNALSFNLLVFGQYIIGALLASNFIQESVNPKYIGILGVLVLLSSAIQQRFRPDVLSTQAKYRLTKCNQIIRILEDGVFEIKAGTRKPSQIVSLRSLASRGLNDLENHEYAGVETYYEVRKASEQAPVPEKTDNHGRDRDLSASLPSQDNRDELRAEPSGDFMPPATALANS